MSEREFDASEITSTISLRSSKIRRVVDSVRAGRGYDADQRAVWSDVDDYLCRTGVHSTSAALQDGLAARRTSADRELVNIRPEPLQLGLALVRADQLVAIDLFGSPTLYARSHDKIVRGILVDVAAASARSDDAHAVVSHAIVQLRQAEPERRSAPSCGECMHGEIGQLVFAALVHQGALYHVMVAGA